VPVALNSGFFWARRSFFKKPGLITVEFLPAIPPGLERKAFLAELKRRIEDGCKRLTDDARQSG
jgi:1-acyl-sn-glycerol-3-phosphate acyltransferase